MGKEDMANTEKETPKLTPAAVEEAATIALRG